MRAGPGTAQEDRGGPRRLSASAAAARGHLRPADRPLPAPGHLHRPACLTVGGRALWEKFDNGDNLLFTQKDFESPGKSALFQGLLRFNDPELRAQVQTLATAAQTPIEQTPVLDEGQPKARRSKAQYPVSGAFAAPASVENVFAAATAGNDTFPQQPGTRYKAKRKPYLVMALFGCLTLLGIGTGAAFLASSGNPENSNTQGPTVGQVLPTPTKQTEPEPEPKKVYLSDLKEFDWVGVDTFFKNGYCSTGVIVVNGVKYPKGLGMHPRNNSDSSVKYRLDGWDTTALEAKVAINDTAGGRTATPLTFQVLGDGNIIWTSKPIQAIHQTQDCKASSRGVRLLELRVICAGSHDSAHAVWLDQYILSKLSNAEIKKRLR